MTLLLLFHLVWGKYMCVRCLKILWCNTKKQKNQNNSFRLSEVALCFCWSGCIFHCYIFQGVWGGGVVWPAALWSAPQVNLIPHLQTSCLFVCYFCCLLFIPTVLRFIFIYLYFILYFIPAVGVEHPQCHI